MCRSAFAASLRLAFEPGTKPQRRRGGGGLRWLYPTPLILTIKNSHSVGESIGCQLYSIVLKPGDRIRMVVGLNEDGSSDTLDKRASAPKTATPLLLTLVAGLICYGLFFNRGLGLSVIGYSIAPAQRVLQGEVPYRDFLFNYTPGILWVNALLMKVFGVTLMTTRIGLFAFKLITLLTLYYVARRLTSPLKALLPVILTLAWPGYQQVFNVFPDQYLMLFALAGLICMLNYDDTGLARWLLLCGVATGAVFLFKYNVGVLLLGAAALAIALRELMTTRRVTIAAKAVALYGSGFAVVAATFVTYLIYNHAFGAMVSHFLHHAAEYSEARSVGLPSPILVLPSALLLIAIAAAFVVTSFYGREFQFISTAFMVAIVLGTGELLRSAWGKVFSDSAIALVAYLPPTVFAVSAALAVWQLKKSEQSVAVWWSRNGAVTITALFALAIYLEVFPRADYFHLVRVLPPVFMFFCVLLVRWRPVLAEQLRNKVKSPDNVASLVLAAPLLFLFVIGVNSTWEPQFESAFHFKDNRELTIERGRGILVEDRQAELTEGLVRLIQENSSKDDYIFSFAQRGSALYFLADRRNASRFLWWRSVGISPEEREGVMTMITNRRAKLIVVQDIAANKEIQDFIGDQYNHIGTVADIAVYGLRK
jgi:4-amino-4-deoxy-L-arabinose transferase-like glycosyltransferase